MRRKFSLPSFPMSGDKAHVVSDEFMFIVRKHGQMVRVKDDEMMVTAYLYKNRVYVDDVEKVNEDDETNCNPISNDEPTSPC